MAVYAGLFEAKSIQEYLFQSGRLRDVIGASELVDALTRGILDNVLHAAGLQPGRNVEFSRRAGGAFYAFFHDRGTRDDFLALWTLVVQQYAPGLAYDLGRGEGADHLAAFDAARESLRADNARHRPVLPVAAPITARSRRTGLAAVHPGGGKDGPMDAATLRKKALSNPASVSFIGRFTPEDTDLSWRHWPNDLEAGDERAFPFNGDDRTVALIHADGNGLGQLLMNARAAVSSRPDRFVPLFHTISYGIENCIQAAAREAVRTVLLPALEGAEAMLPARPIVLGGDDLTILVRADLALPFLKAFATAFEAHSGALMQELIGEGVERLPDRLTVGAGVVFMCASQPFYLASHLAESLMAMAKRRAKTVSAEEPPGSVAFHRVTSSLVDDYDALLRNQRTVYFNGQTYTDTLGTYALGTADGLPKLDDLVALQALLASEDMARGPSRQLLTLMGLAPLQAKTRYARWRQQMGEKASAQRDAFDRLMGQLCPGFDQISALPYVRVDDGHVSPLGDALALKAVGNRTDLKTKAAV